MHRINFDAAGAQVQLNGLFISAKRYSITRPDGSFADFKESILGMYLPPTNNWVEEAWRSIGEILDARRLSPQTLFPLPAVRALTASSPAYAREISGLPGLRPWNRFLAATAIGRKLGEGDFRSEVVVAPFEGDPQRLATSPWRFVGSGEPLLLAGPDREGVQWKLRTLRDLLCACARHAIPEMLAPDGSRCGSLTRGVLRRRPVRDGERWLVLKEAAVYGTILATHFLFRRPKRCVRVKARPTRIGRARSSTLSPWLALEILRDFFASERTEGSKKRTK